MPFPLYKGILPERLKWYEKRKRTESDPVAPFTIFDVAKLLDIEFLENCKNGYQVKRTPRMQQMLYAHFVVTPGERQASVSVQKGKS